MPRDKFLQEQIKLEDGWIPLEIMLKFKRLANLTTDADVIVTALEESKLIEVRICTVPYSSLINWYFRHFQNQEQSYLTDVRAIYFCLICNKKKWITLWYFGEGV